MSLPRIIGITGRAGAGKDTLADYFVREHGYVKLSFAEPLKQAVKERFALEDDDFDRDAKEEPFECFGFSADYDGDEIRLDEYFSLRSWLQWLGTDFARKLFGEDCWVCLLSNRIDEYPPQTKFVISDVRFDNEAEFVREEGGVIIHVVRSGAKDDEHSSEAGIAANELDFVLFNDESVAELEQGAAELLGIEAPSPQTWGTGWDDYLMFINSTWRENQDDERAHVSYGLGSEAGEVLGVLQRAARGECFDRSRLKKELGDLLYFWTKMCDIYGFEPEDVVADNVAKILDRKARGAQNGYGDDR